MQIIKTKVGCGGWKEWGREMPQNAVDWFIMDNRSLAGAHTAHQSTIISAYCGSDKILQSEIIMQHAIW